MHKSGTIEVERRNQKVENCMRKGSTRKYNLFDFFFVSRRRRYNALQLLFKHKSIYANRI